MLIWLKDAPMYDETNPDSSSKVKEFIDGLISCDAKVEGVIHQEHRHTRTCKKATKEGIVCRFNIPFPPMPETIILQPFPSTFPKVILKHHQSVFAKVKLGLEQYKNQEYDTSFEEFLKKNSVSFEEYISAVRSSIRRVTVFLKRSTSSCFTNPYIKDLSTCWKANMDVQFILEPYGCARYISAYVSKANGGISKLLKAAVDEARSGNLNVRYRDVDNKYWIDNDGQLFSFLS
jgi:hypothetical protein